MILLHWKIHGQVVTDQHILYLEQQISLEQLNNLTPAWLNEHACAVDVESLLAATKQAVIEREKLPPADTNANSSASIKETSPSSHTVVLAPATNQRESWSDIAQQYALAPLALLKLNPSYDADPMRLAIGDTLIEKEPQPKEAPPQIHGFPSVAPQAYNNPANIYYKYSERLLKGPSKLLAIETTRKLPDDVAVVRVANIEEKNEFTPEQNELIKRFHKPNNTVIISGFRPLDFITKEGLAGDMIEAFSEELLGGPVAAYANVDLSHEHLFIITADRKVLNIGYMSNGIETGPVELENVTFQKYSFEFLGKYSLTNHHLELKGKVDIVNTGVIWAQKNNFTKDNYSLLTHNCQTFAEAYIEYLAKTNTVELWLR